MFKKIFWIETHNFIKWFVYIQKNRTSVVGSRYQFPPIVPNSLSNLFLFCFLFFIISVHKSRYCMYFLILFFFKEWFTRTSHKWRNRSPRSSHNKCMTSSNWQTWFAIFHGHFRIRLKQNKTRWFFCWKGELEGRESTLKEHPASKTWPVKNYIQFGACGGFGTLFLTYSPFKIKLNKA